MIRLGPFNIWRKLDMHTFHEIVDRCAEFTLSALDKAQQNIAVQFEHSGTTALVKALQMVQLQRVISSVGMFSIFDALLQDRLQCKDGFREAEILLNKCHATELLERFTKLRLAINVLKHGVGRSYEELLAKNTLPFKMKSSSQGFFDEGDVSEVDSLIEIDDEFVMACAIVISDVSHFLSERKS